MLNVIPWNNQDGNDVYNTVWGSTIYLGAYIDWDKLRKSNNRVSCVYGYSVYKNASLTEKTLLHRKYIPSEGVVSPYEAEMKALLAGIVHIPPEDRLMVQTTQPSIANGINRYLEYWAKHRWHTKQGTLVKCQQEWEEFYNLTQDRNIAAFVAQEDEIGLLQLYCKVYLQFLSRS